MNFPLALYRSLILIMLSIIYWEIMSYSVSFEEKLFGWAAMFFTALLSTYKAKEQP